MTKVTFETDEPMMDIVKALGQLKIQRLVVEADPPQEKQV